MHFSVTTTPRAGARKWSYSTFSPQALCLGSLRTYNSVPMWIKSQLYTSLLNCSLHLMQLHFHWPMTIYYGILCISNTLIWFKKHILLCTYLTFYLHKVPGTEKHMLPPRPKFLLLPITWLFIYPYICHTHLHGSWNHCYIKTWVTVTQLRPLSACSAYAALNFKSLKLFLFRYQHLTMPSSWNLNSLVSKRV
jgi:hypothetical protein